MEADTPYWSGIRRTPKEEKTIRSLAEHIKSYVLHHVEIQAGKKRSLSS